MINGNQMMFPLSLPYGMVLRAYIDGNTYVILSKDSADKLAEYFEREARNLRVVAKSYRDSLKKGPELVIGTSEMKNTENKENTENGK